MTKLILVRHAEAEGNIKRRFHGWTDGDITKKGEIQAKRLAERIKDFKIDVLYSSSLRRTVRTAEFISDATGLKIIKNNNLWEINGGDWEDELFENLVIKWPEDNFKWEKTPHVHVMPNGESMKGFKKRIKNEIENILVKNQNKSICVVTHGTVIKVLMTCFKGWELDKMPDVGWHDNTSISIIEFGPKNPDIILEGDNTHLSLELSTIMNQDWWKKEQKALQNKKNQP